MRQIPSRVPKLAALLAGCLAATGFEPLNLWPLALTCFALLIVLIEQAPDRRSAFMRGWLFGVGHFTLGLNWIAHAFTFQDAMPHWFGCMAAASPCMSWRFSDQGPWIDGARRIMRALR